MGESAACDNAGKTRTATTNPRTNSDLEELMQMTNFEKNFK
jgi:hypothetical protein